MTKPAIEVPVEYPSNEKEMITYLVYNIFYHGVNHLDSDEYLDVESEYACEVDFTLEEYDDDDTNSKWNRHLESLMRQTYFAISDINSLIARNCRNN